MHGHSSHHPRPIEVYRDKLVLYGCGDLVDDYEGIRGYEEFRDGLQLLYFVSVQPQTGKLASLRMVPMQGSADAVATCLTRGQGVVSGRPRPGQPRLRYADRPPARRRARPATTTRRQRPRLVTVDAFRGAGYHVSYRKPENGDYGVMIASRVQARTDDFGDRVGYLPSRAAALTLPTPHGPIQVIDAYVPSRDATAEKTERKRKWLAACTAALATRNPSCSDHGELAHRRMISSAAIYRTLRA
jgi:Bacterial capsule synthesis protein PGA_cap